MWWWKRIWPVSSRKGGYAARRSTALRTTGAPENPFLSIPAERVLLTPHLAGVTRAAFGRMLSQALENLERVLVHGQPPRFVVNGVLADYSD